MPNFLNVFKDKRGTQCLWLPLDKQITGVFCNLYTINLKFHLL